jgi:hypothetical protein
MAESRELFDAIAEIEFCIRTVEPESKRAIFRSLTEASRTFAPSRASQKLQTSNTSSHSEPCRGRRPTTSRAKSFEAAYPLTRSLCHRSQHIKILVPRAFFMTSLCIVLVHLPVHIYSEPIIPQFLPSPVPNHVVAPLHHPSHLSYVLSPLPPSPSQPASWHCRSCSQLISPSNLA